MKRRWTVLTCALPVVAGALIMGAAGKTGTSSPASATGDTLRVHLGPADGGTDAFVARPPGKAPAPGVIVIQEWWGLNGQIREVARRLARQGYVAIAPDLYHGVVTDDPEKAHELTRGLEDARVLADLNAAVGWLRTQPRTEKTKLGVIGFCLGGGYSLQLALESPQISAAVMYYGHPETDPAKLATLNAPLQGHFGLEDQGIPAAKVAEFSGALKQAGKTAEIYTYPGAGHAFMNETRPSYHADAARLGWARTLAFYQKHLKG